jgi:hypothetical protein
MNEGVNLQPEWVTRAAEHRPPVRLPQVSRLWRHQCHARPACPDSPRGGAQGHGRAHQAGPGRHPRNRVHRPGLPVDPRRPRAGIADPADTAGSRAARRASPAAAETERELAAAYDFLRRLEHRLQYVATPRRTACRAADEERQQIATLDGLCRLASLLLVLDGAPRDRRPPFRAGLLGAGRRPAPAGRNLGRPGRRRRCARTLVHARLSASRRRCSNVCRASARAAATCNCRRATASASTPSGHA